MRSLGTSDLREAKTRRHAELARIDAEFAHKRQTLNLERVSLAAKRISTLSDEQLRGVASFWLHQVLASDEQRRGKRAMARRAGRCCDGSGRPIVRSTC